MGKGLLAALLGALAMFVWGYLSWAVLHLMPEQGFKNGAAVAAAMRASGDGDGVYFVPLMPDPETAPAAHEEWTKNFARGPRAMVILNTGEEDVDKLMVTSMVKGFLVMLASCLLVAMMLAKAGIGNYMGRVLFCVTLGAVIAVYSNGGGWAWFHSPLNWTLPAIVNDIVAWGCAGLVMGTMIKPR